MSTSSDISQIQSRLNSTINQIRLTALKVLEIEGKKSIQTNFIQQGRPKWRNKFIDDGRAILTGKTARLQSQINVVRNDTTSTIAIGSNLPYSKIQQEGGKIPITPKMRKFFWAKFKETKNVKWKYLALKKGSTINIPSRKYLSIPESDYGRIKSSVEVGVKRVIQ